MSRDPTFSASGGRWAPWALALLVGASLGLSAPLWRDTLHDDAFISMRYARNLAAGEGLVFNPGERVEGYTNFLWTLLLAAAARLGVHLPALCSVFSVLPALLLTLVLYRFGVLWAGLPHRGWALVAPALVALHPFWIAESVGGLETTLFVLLVVLGFERAVACGRGAARPGTAGAVLAVATLVRPEGALAFAALVGSWLVAPRARSRAWQREALAWAILVLPFVVFRYAYYGDWLPNTFHAKVGWSTAQLVRGGAYVAEYGHAVVPLPILLVAALEAAKGGWRTGAGLVLAMLAVYATGVGGDFAPTGRFVVLAAPFAALLVQSAAARLGASRRARRRLAAALLCLLAAGGSIALESSRLRARAWPASFRRDLAARRALGEWFARALPPDATVAVGSIGAIGWYSERRVLDTFGLTNRAIGQLDVDWMGQASAGHEKGSARVILDAAPEVIVFDRAFLARREVTLEEFLSEARSPSERMLVEDGRFYERYGLRTVAVPQGVLHYLERTR